MPSSQRKRRTPSEEPGLPKRRPPRMAEVRRTRQRVLLMLYLVLGVVIATGLLTSPVFGIKHVRVQGTESLPPEEVAVTTGMMTLRPGVNWFRVPVSNRQQRLARLPWVQAAQVRRVFPDTVQARITLREPAVIVETPTAAFEVDAQGVPIRTARPEVSARLQHVVLEGSPVLQPGVALASASVLTAIQIFRSVWNDPVVRIAKIQVDQNDNLCLNMRNGIRIRFGRNEAIDTKLQLTRRALAKEPDIAARLEEINLSCPEAPACTPRVAATSPPVGSGSTPAPNVTAPPRVPTQGSQDGAYPDQTI
ncbi:MAG TPA: FtsQ-type POTRA domain-containing protein [Chthonomonadaceae bacterium]|nr:FtsQ-type POTRA domain-containing protein [Chthonomonadaceae bacterium]